MLGGCVSGVTREEMKTDRLSDVVMSHPGDENDFTLKSIDISSSPPLLLTGGVGEREGEEEGEEGDTRSRQSVADGEKDGAR